MKVKTPSIQQASVKAQYPHHRRKNPTSLRPHAATPKPRNQLLPKENPKLKIPKLLQILEIKEEINKQKQKKQLKETQNRRAWEVGLLCFFWFCFILLVYFCVICVLLLVGCCFMCVVFGKNNNKTKIKQIKRNQKTTLRRGRLFGLVFVSFWFGIIVVYFLSSNFFGCLPDLISCLLVVFVCVCVCVCVFPFGFFHLLHTSQ